MIAQRILAFIHQETGGLHKAAYVLAFFTFISQILGLVRDRILAHTFGAGEVLDIYYAAFRIPDLALIFAGSIVSIAVIVPVLTGKMREGRKEALRFMDSIFSFFFISIIFLSLALFFLAPFFLKLLFPGFIGEDSFSKLLLLTRIFLLSPLFLGISSLFSGVVQVHKRFLIYALSPIFYNLGIIVGILFLYPLWGIEGLALGVVLGAFLHMIVQAPSVYEKKLFPRFTLKIDWKEVKGVLFSSVPRSFTLSITSIVILILLGFASLLGEGSIAIFNLAFNLQSVPLSIVGVSYSLAAFPMLALLYAEGQRVEFVKKVEVAARHIIFWSLPALTLFIVLRAQIVRSVLGTGEFGWIETRLTAATLAILILSVFAQSLILLFVRSYYAAGDTKKPLLFGIISGAFTILIAFFLLEVDSKGFLLYFIESLLKVGDIDGTSMLYLPFAFSLGSMINLLLLYFAFVHRFGAFSSSFWRTSRHAFYTSIVAGFVAFHGLRFFVTFLDTQTVLGIFLQGLFSGVAGVIGGVLVLLFLKNEEIIDVARTLRKRFAKSEVLLPEQTEL